MSDTINLLKECDAGIRMGIDSIDKVIDRVSNSEFKNKLIEYKNDYNHLQDEIIDYLNEFECDGKNPNPLAMGMANLKTEIKLSLNDTDATIADLMTEGCNMGVKSLNKYLNQYTAAKDKAKELAKKLIRLMDNQEFDIRKYL